MSRVELVVRQRCREVAKLDMPWILSANLLRYVTQFCTLGILALVYGADAAGNFAMAIAIAGPIFVVLGLGLRNLYFTLSAKPPTADFRLVRLVAASVAALVSAALGLIFLGELPLILLAVIIGKWFDGLIDLESAILQRAKRVRAMIWPYLFQLVVTIIVLSVGAVRSMDADRSVFAALALGGAVAAISIRSLTGRSTSRGDVRRLLYMRKILRAGVPTGVSYGMVGLVSTIPQYFLFNISGPAAVAHFATIMYIGTALELLLNSQSQALIGERSASLDKGRVLSDSLVTGMRWARLAVVAAALMVGLYFFFACRMFGSEFSMNATVAAIVLVYSVVLSFVYSVAAEVTLRRMYKALPAINFVTVVAVSVLSWVLIPPLGVTGAFLGLVGAHLARLVFAGLFLKVRGAVTGGRET